MADETKTQIPKPTRQRGPMGRICLLYTSPSPRDS